jgi:hypothetical protein
MNLIQIELMDLEIHMKDHLSPYVRRVLQQTYTKEI